MGKHLRADDRAREAPSMASDVSFRPALTDISGACAYLGNIGRSKFYSDLLPKLDVVKFGTRTFITLESLDRLITANCQLAVEADEESNEPIRQTTISISAAPDASRRCPRLEQLGRANVRIRPTGHERAASLAEEPYADGEFTNAAVKQVGGSS